MDQNYYNTFIEVAGDCPASAGVIPPRKGDKKTIALIHYELIGEHPYQYTQEDVLFETYAQTHDIPDAEREAERVKFFSKGQACLRGSPLGKRYGWGIHADAEGRVALYALGTPEYEQFVQDDTLKHLKALRQSRA